MKFRRLLIGLSVLVMTHGQVQAKDSAIDTSHFKNMGLTVQEATQTDIEGLYEVVTDQGIFYASKNGELLISGRLFDITGSEPVNLSDIALNKMRRDDLPKFEDSMIVYQAPDEQHVVTIFTDTTCGYCRQLHGRMEDYLAAGITIRYLAFPRGGLQGEGYRQLQSAWCAEDQKTAMTRAKDDKVLQIATCDDPIAEHYALGQKFGVRGTPAIVLENGALVPGFRPPEALLKDLANAE